MPCEKRESIVLISTQETAVATQITAMVAAEMLDDGLLGLETFS